MWPGTGNWVEAAVPVIGSIPGCTSTSSLPSPFTSNTSTYGPGPEPHSKPLLVAVGA